MKAEIITIGDEILIGHTVDTNSAFIARRLNLIGIRVAQITSVSDEREHILNALEEITGRADVVIITGGLGPTSDDITKHTLVEFLEDTLVFNEEVFEHIRRKFEARGREIGEHNKNQARVPSRCEVLPNEHGTAPGMWVELEGCVLISLPGVPQEMRSIMESSVLGKLAGRNNEQAVVHRYVLTQGIPESVLMVKIEYWENTLPAPLKLAYLPSAGMVKLRLSAEATESREVIGRKISLEIEKLYPLIAEYIVGYDDETLQIVVGRLLKERGATLATAESCTGGFIAHLLTSVSGSSDYFLGTVVAYQNEMKQQFLGVERSLLDQYGAVSREVVEAMARGIRKATGADWAIATSGIAGPLGGSPEKPVGTVWIAIASEKGVSAEKHLFGEHRQMNIERSAVTALNMLRKELLSTFAN